MSNDDDIEREERTIYAVAIVALAPVVIITILQHVAFGGSETLCLLVVVLGLVGLFAGARLPRRRTKLARARARSPHK